MFENKKTKVGGIHYTRYIESWRDAGGELIFTEFFEDWLRSEGCTEEEIHDIEELCIGGGKFELERSAEPYIAKQKEAIKKVIEDQTADEADDLLEEFYAIQKKGS